MTSREIIFGIVGAVLGGGLGVLLTKKHYEKKCIDTINAELESLRKEEYPEITKSYESKDTDKPVDEVSYSKGFGKKVEKTNYENMYRAKKLTEEAIEELDNGDESFEEYDREKNHHRPPECISDEALGEVPAYYDHIDLMYYTDDDILTDENDNVIHDRERILGNLLVESGFIGNDDSFLFIRNYELSTVYEIQKFVASFEQEEDY